MDELKFGFKKLAELKISDVNKIYASQKINPKAEYKKMLARMKKKL